MRYSNTGKIKENGVIYTPETMANYLASEMLKYRRNVVDGEIFILDPAVGEGRLLISMIEALKKENLNVQIHVTGYETDDIIAQKTLQVLSEMFPDIKICIKSHNFLEVNANDIEEKYDFIIANPPYIRTQIMGSKRAQKISEELSLSGRVDIYYAFLLHSKSFLKSTGIAGFITSNKFMTIKAGKSVRNFMLDNYLIHRITDLGDTKLFSASVLPCILIFSLGKTLDKQLVEFTSVYEEKSKQGKVTATVDIFDRIHDDGTFKLSNGKTYNYQQGKLQSIQMDSLWTISSNQHTKWIKKVEQNTWGTFAKVGTVRVGIKTTADCVFIGDDWTGENKNLELLQPLITHRNAGQIISNNNAKWQVLYTHKIENGKKIACDIDKYPKSKKYLLQHFNKLNSRSYIKKANRNWYEIWVPQNPSSWKHRKIVFRDISEKPQFWIDDTGAIVNGDCYWIEFAPNINEEIIYLVLAVANSPFIEKYYDIKFNTKLYSGKRRYQKQYVEQFPIPYYDSPLAQKAISLTKEMIFKENCDKLECKKNIDFIIDMIFN